MKFLIVGKTTSTQVDRLDEEARKKGHEIDSCASSDLIIIADGKDFLPKIEGFELASYDLIYLLSVGERKWEWYVACSFLNKRYKTVVIEHKMIDSGYKVFFSPTSELLKFTEEGIPFPKTAVVLAKDNLDKVLANYSYPLIIKNSYGQRGEGVSKVNSIEEARGVLENDIKSHSFHIREFIPNDGDIRIFTIGYKAIGAMKRVPAEGEFRSNISRGGVGTPFDLAENRVVVELAEKVSKLTRSEIAGVDIMVNKETGNPYVLEINRGPQFAGLEKYGKVNVAERIIQYFEERVNAK